MTRDELITRLEAIAYPHIGAHYPEVRALYAELVRDPDVAARLVKAFVVPPLYPSLRDVQQAVAAASPSPSPRLRSYGSETFFATTATIEAFQHPGPRACWFAYRYCDRSGAVYRGEHGDRDPDAPAEEAVYDIETELSPHYRADEVSARFAVGCEIPCLVSDENPYRHRVFRP